MGTVRGCGHPPRSALSLKAPHANPLPFGCQRRSHEAAYTEPRSTAKEKVPAHCDPEPPSLCRHHPVHSPGAIRTCSCHHGSRVRELLVQETQPHVPAQICTQNTESSAVHFIFLEQIKFSPQHEEDVSRYLRCGNKYSVLQVSVVSFTVARCLSQRTPGPAVFSEPRAGPSRHGAAVSPCSCFALPPSLPLSFILPCC